MPIPIFQRAPFVLGARPIMLFGMGSHDFPLAKASVGHYMLGLLAQRLGIKFHKYRSVSATVAHYPDENLLLVQPDTYLLKDNTETLQRVTSRWPSIDLDRSIFLYSELNLRVGEVRYITFGRTGHNSELMMISDAIGNHTFRRIGIGIDYPVPGVRLQTPLAFSLHLPVGVGINEIYALNRFNRDHWKRLHQEAVPKVFSAIDDVIGDIRKEWALPEVDPSPVFPGVGLEPEVTFEEARQQSMREAQEEQKQEQEKQETQSQGEEEKMGNLQELFNKTPSTEQTQSASQTS